MKQPTGTVREWMTPDPVTILADTSLLRAYEVMQARSVRRLPVVDETGRLVGILTRSDLLQMMPFAHGAPLQSDVVFALAGQTVAEVMTPDPVTVEPDAPLGRVAKQMITHKISGIPVVMDGRVVGIITESDIFRLVVESWPDTPAT